MGCLWGVKGVGTAALFASSCGPAAGGQRKREASQGISIRAAKPKPNVHLCGTCWALARALYAVPWVPNYSI
jgi:hypothetical protein